jgi:hypothetical protein
MSKRINVNPDHYKVAGRERPGHIVGKAPRALADERAAQARWAERQNKRGKLKPAK